jgi:hypothetical protein
MFIDDPIYWAEDCRLRACATADGDQQALLEFMAEAWQAIAETGEPSAAVPAFLRPSEQPRLERSLC